MNILHISTPLSWRGGEQQLAYLLKELQKKGHEQSVICAAGGAMEAFCIENEIVFFGIETGILSIPSNASFTKRVADKYKIDIIHTHDSKAHTIAYISALLGNKTPVIVSRRVDFPVGKSWLSLKKYNHPSVKAIICVSKTIMEITGKSIVNKKVLKVVYDGIETDISSHGPVPDLEKLYGIPKGGPIIGNIAALAPHKDYFTWVDTAANLKNKYPGIHFLIVGDGPLKNEIATYIHNKGLGDAITMTGFLEDAKNLIRSFDVFLNTSETEGLGSSLLDAMIRGIPVVATAAGGIPEIIINERTGLLAPVKQPDEIAKQVERLLNDPTLKAGIIENARSFAFQFDKAIMAEKTMEVYREVCG